MKKLFILLITTSVFLSGCAINHAVNRDETKQFYFVFDLKPKVDNENLIDALEQSLDYNVANFRSEHPIPSENIPDKPGRFKVVDPFKGSRGMMALVNTAQYKMAVCEGDGLLYKATASKEVGSNTMKMTVCLWEYKGGYSLDFYSVVHKGDGSLMTKMATAIVSKAMWTPEEWAQAKAFDAIRAIQEKVGVKAKLKISYPRIKGEPWNTGDYKGKGLVG